MTQIGEIIQLLEQIAPAAYQESYDNSGLLVGASDTTVTGALLTLDCTEAVVDEAISRNCNLVIAHHPIVFKGLTRITGKNYVERTLLKAIKNDIAIYAIHTNLDNVLQGVNRMIAQKLGLVNTRVLNPKKQLLKKLTFFVPVTDTQPVLEALYVAGVGNIGNYSRCSFRTEGTGTFRPATDANPVIGVPGQDEEVTENRVEVIFPSFLEQPVVSALRRAHPYEEVAYYVHQLENENQEVGSGLIGELPEGVSPTGFLSHLKKSMGLSVIKYTPLQRENIRKVAVCGGAGSFLLGAAKRNQADAFVTADFKYHEFFDAEQSLMICDIGHYESEVFTKDLLFKHLSEKFSNFALYLSEVNTNPVSYFV